MAGNQNLVAKIIINAQDDASKIFQSIKDNAGKLAAALSVIFSIDIFKSAVNDAADFEEQLTITGVKAGATGDDLLKLKTAAVEIGNEFGKTGTEALQGLEIIASAGYKTEESISLLAPAFALADNSGKTLTESSSYLIKIMQSLGLETGKAGEVTDILTIASSQANTKVGDLTDALLESGGTAKTFGLNIKDTAAILDVLAGAGKSGAEAGTALRNILLQVSDPSSKASLEFQKLGIHSTDLVTIFKALAEKGQAGKDALLALNTGDIAAANGILSNIGSYDKLRGGLEGIDGAAKKASDALGENFKAAYEDLGALWTNLKTQLGTPILTPFKEAIVSLQGKIKELTDSGVIDKIGQSLASAFKAGVTAFSEFAKTIDFTTIGDSIKNFAIKTALTFDEISAGAKAFANGFSLGFNSIATVFNGLQTTAASFGVAVVSMFATVNKTVAQVAIGWGELFKLVPGMKSVGEAIGGMGKYLSKSADESIKFAKALKEEATVQANETAKAAQKAAGAFNELTQSASQTAPKLADIWTQSTNAAAAQKDLATSTEIAAQSHNNQAQTIDNNAPKWVKHIDALGRVTYENTSLQKATDNTTKTLADSGKSVGDLSQLYTKQVDELGRVTLGNIGLKKSADETKTSTDELSKSIGTVPDKESKITAKTATANSNVEAVKTKIAEIPTEHQTTAKVSEQGTQDVLNAIAQIPRDVYTTVHVKSVQENSSGGQIQNFANGGTPLYDVNFQRREGGLGGYGGGDTVPAMLEPGEWIIKKESVQKYGDSFMAKLNAGQIEDIPKFASGGKPFFGGANTKSAENVDTSTDEKELNRLVDDYNKRSARGDLSINDYGYTIPKINELKAKIASAKAKQSAAPSSSQNQSSQTPSAQPKQNEEITINFKFQNGASARANATKVDAKTIVDALRDAADRGISI